MRSTVNTGLDLINAIDCEFRFGLDEAEDCYSHTT